MDQNVGLEMFDKGDFTSTKEDKKMLEEMGLTTVK